MERGTLVHKALETVWDRLTSHAQLCASTEAELGAVVEAAVSDALAAYTNGFAMMENPPLVDKEGYMTLPQGPGLGVAINKDLIL